MYRNLLYGLLLTLIIIAISFFYILSKTKVTTDFRHIYLILDKRYLFLALISLFLFHTFDNLRVFIISKSIGLNYPFWYGYFVSIISTFGATVTPAHLGGEFLPFYTLARKGGHFYQVMSIITLKGISGFFFYVIFFPWTVTVLIKNPREAREFLFIVGGITLLSFLIYVLWQIIYKKNKKFFDKTVFSRVKRSILKYIVTCRKFFRERKIVFLWALVLSLFMYFSLIFIGVFLVKSFNTQASIKEIFLRQLPLIYAIFISPTPGGSGVGELGALPVFEIFLPAKYLGIFTILWRILSQYLSAFIGGIFFGFFLLYDLLKTRNA